MHIVMGATGHVGSAVVRRLVDRGEEVLAITHSRQSFSKIEAMGAKPILADVADTAKLATVFAQGDSLFVLNPPGDVSGDAVGIERRNVASILEALRGSSIRKIVAESTQGAQKGEGIGDLGVLYELEEGLKAWGGDCRITRAAYYMSNWDMQIEQVKESGRLTSFFPADFKLAMVCPIDLGNFNADQMSKPFSGFEVVDVSGPEDYTPADVARELGRFLDLHVAVEVISREEWPAAFKKLGFSETSAESYAAMTAITLDRAYEVPSNPVRGPTSLHAHFESILDEDAGNLATEQPEVIV